MIASTQKILLDRERVVMVISVDHAYRVFVPTPYDRQDKVSLSAYIRGR